MSEALLTRASLHPHGFLEVEPEQVHAHLEDLRVVDVREPMEFEGPLGHVPGSDLVPLAALQAEARNWARDHALVLVCRSGNRSGIATQLLKRMGFEKVMNMRGGMIRYGELGLPRGPKA